MLLSWLLKGLKVNQMALNKKYLIYNCHYEDADCGKNAISDGGGRVIISYKWTMEIGWDQGGVKYSSVC